MKYFFKISVVVLLWIACAPSLQALNILLASGSMDVTSRLQGLGHSVTVSNASTWGSNFNYAAYDVVAFMYGSTNPGDIAHLVSSVDAGLVGVVVFRGTGAEATTNALGLTNGATANSLFYQTPTSLNIVNNSHFITSNLSLGNHSLGYTYMSYMQTPGTNTTTLATGPSGAALVVHNSRRVVFTPFYGHSSGYTSETQTGLDITQRSLLFAAQEVTPVPEASTWILLGVVLPYALWKRKTRLNLLEKKFFH